jgi:eukaryotic-like serine/threonine-protein kinase
VASIARATESSAGTSRSKSWTFARIDQGFVVAPDGAHAVMSVNEADRQRTLWLRAMDTGVVTRLPGTANARTPFWSPDSRWVGFFADGRLQKIDILGGPPQALCNATQGYASWSSQGVILLAAAGQPLQRVADTGGTPVTAIPFDEARHENVQIAPFFLPDGRHFLYDTRTTGSERGIAWASLDGRERRFVIQNRNSPATFVPSRKGRTGWMLYNSGRRLLAHRFDPDRGELLGEPRLIADSVAPGPQWSASSTGLVVFPHLPQRRSQLVWRGRDGNRLGSFAEPGDVHAPRLSPDGKTVAYTRIQGLSDIWLFDVIQNASTRLTFEERGASPPVWIPDGTRILHATARQSRQSLVERPTSGIGSETVLKQFPDSDQHLPTAISRDGRWLSVISGGGGDEHTTLISRPAGKEVSFPEARALGVISPDGRWVAYRTDAAGRPEVFVQSVPPDAGGPTTPAKFQISFEGGDRPVWRADGREIFYVAPNRDVVAVAIESGATTFRRRSAVTLFNAGAIAEYDVTADGRRFVMNEVMNVSDSPYTVIINWTRLVEE